MTPPAGSNASHEAWLHSLIRPNLRPYAERAPLALASVAALLDRIGHPEQGLRCIHIAGSKGKGSAALMIEALLEREGVRTGTFTSPHLERWTERFRLGGAEVSDELLNRAFGVVKPHVDALSESNPDNPPSFFDVLTATALWLFKQQGVDIAIIETGIGGRYDATNVVEPVVTCITNIELEHTDKLGPGLADIAQHKAGILRPGAPAVLGRFGHTPAKVIRDAVGSTGCAALWLKEAFDFESAAENGGQRVRFRLGDASFGFLLNHPSRFMAENAALALACVASLPGFDFARVTQAAAALETVSLPGRAEVLQRSPWIVVDAAHTPASVAALAELLNTLPCNERHFLISLSGDKTIDLLAPLLETATSVTVTYPEPLRSMPADTLAKSIRTRWPGLEVHTEPDVAGAFTQARSKLASDALLCVTGSTYVAGAVRTSIAQNL